MSARTRNIKAGTASKRSSATPSTTGVTKGKGKAAKAVVVKEELEDTDSDIKPKEVGRGRGRKSMTGSISTARVPKKSDSVGIEEMKEKAKSGPKMKDIFCSCTAGDDGSPMIFCSACRIWYHLTCADLSEADAEEISVYICPTCSQTTGRRAALDWQGEETLEEDTDDERTYNERRRAILGKMNFGKTPEPPAAAAVQPVKQTVAEESRSEEAGAGDGYADDDADEEEEEEKENKENRKAKQARRLSTAHLVETENESSEAESTTRGRKRLARMKRKATGSASPTAPSKRATASVSTHGTPNAQLKRKASTTTALPTTKLPPPKRKRKLSDDARDNPTRKYCLKKLEEILIDVYLRYPHVRVRVDEEAAEENDQSNSEAGWKRVPKSPADLTNEEREAVINDAKAFTTEFEGCLYEAMNEPDKMGQPSAGTKYKNHFRMLEFNLKKPDRAPLHKRITSGDMSPQELAALDSIDLADEETKQSIKQAEKEALEHSILPTLTAPRAKITHKGLQDIEDVNGNLSSMRELERQEQEEAERREKEKQARARAAADAQRQRTASISVPPESPTVPGYSPTSENWGAPPPVPAHAMASHSPVDTTNPAGPVETPADQPQSELNLDDLINIDEDHGGPLTIDTSLAQPTSSTATTSFSPVITTTPTAISPFASQAERNRAPSFDLNSIWSGPNPASDGQPLVAETLTEEPTSAEGAGSEEEMELESVEANDQDFDMFLDNTETDAQTQNQPQQQTPAPSHYQNSVSLDALPDVWTGKITMPLDSSVPPETPLYAKQVAGRETIPPGSPLWKVLFPSDVLRIEGRVPVDNSIKYLVQTRLNPAKEIYAVALSPSPAGEADFKAYCDFLISRGRHGLLFPWGSRPKDSSPGREFYVVPLTPNQPLPEFMEMLDNLQLPADRSRTYLIGIWILNRGKLVAHPSPPPQVAGPSFESTQSSTPVQPIPSLPFTIPSFLIPSATPNPNAPVATHSPAIPSQPPSMMPTMPTLPSNMPPIQSPPTAAPALNPNALFAEVASLTPEQIQNVLRTLMGSGLPLPGQPPAVVPPPASITPVLPPPHIPTPPIMPPAHQSWMGSIAPPPPPQPPQPPYPMSFPPLQAHSSFRQAQPPPPPPPPPMMNMPSIPPHSPYDPHAMPPAQHQRNDYDYDYDYRQGSGYQHQDRGGDRVDRGGWRPRGDSGGRGRGGHRGRGRGGGGSGGPPGPPGPSGHQDYRSDDRRHSDQGWPRRRQDGW